MLNLGIAGLAIHHAVDRLEQIGLRLDPDLIVYGSTLNDVEGPRYRSFSRPPERGPELWAPFFPSRSYLWRLLNPRILSLRDLVWPAPGSYVYELDYNYFENPWAWAHFKHGLDRLATIGNGRGVCVLVLVHTLLHQLNVFHPLERHYDAIAKAARERGLHARKSSPRFRGRDARSLWVSAYDPHPNAEGHRLLAAALLDGLKELPPRCGLPRLDAAEVTTAE